VLDDTDKTLISHPGLLNSEDPSDEESKTELPMKPPSKTLPSTPFSQPTVLHAPDPNDDWDFEAKRMDVNGAHGKATNQVKKCKE
jgi:hypothetical protein